MPVNTFDSERMKAKVLAVEWQNIKQLLKAKFPGPYDGDGEIRREEGWAEMQNAIADGPDKGVGEAATVRILKLFEAVQIKGLYILPLQISAA